MEPDHPRSRGEYASVPVSLIRWCGSSPLSRGIHLDQSLIQALHRIIPALAGNTMAWINKGPFPRDHPRSRGEYFLLLVVGFFLDGSSPLSRGIHLDQSLIQALHRIIPALAGNTYFQRRDTLHWGDHPRSRGEYVFGQMLDAAVLGSSPLSRGILPQLEVIKHGVGIIPALAGNTASWARASNRRQDHPRSRGEY